MSGEAFAHRWPAPGRPGLITAVAISSIIIGSIGLLANLCAVLVANGISHYAVRPAPVARVPVASPPPHEEYVAPDGLSASQRQIVIDGLSQARALSEPRKKQLDALLADAGREVIRVAPENLTVERASAYVTDVKDLPDASGGPADDVFDLGSGRLQLGDQSAVFFPDNSPSGIRTHGGSYSDDTGTHLASSQISAVVDRVQNLCDQAMNDNQTAALRQQLEMTTQTLIVPSASVAQTAEQVRAAQVLADGTVAVTTGSGSISLGVQGDTWPAMAPLSTVHPSWARPHAARLDVTLLTLESILSFLAAGYLLCAGILTLQNSPRGRRLHLGYAIGKIILAGLACYAIYAVAAELNAAAPDAGAAALAWMLICAAPGFIYPIALLIVINLRGVREFFSAPVVARIY